MATKSCEVCVEMMRLFAGIAFTPNPLGEG